MKKVLYLLTIIFLLTFISNVKAVYTPDKSHSAIKKGEVIYFDASGLDWQHVYIHIWEKNGDIYKDWSNDDEMTVVEGTDNIYQFTMPNDADEKYNMIIFKNGISGSANQTISLGHLAEGYAYIVDGYSDGKRIGYWHLYDKSDYVTRLNTLKQYQVNKDYYTSSSYANLDDLIINIENALQNEIRLEQDTTDPSKFYTQVDYTLGDADDIVNALKVNTDLLSDLIDQEENNYSDYENEYTKDSLDNLKEVINSQKEVLNNNNITVDDIKDGINDINEAKNNLVNQADKTELKKQLKEISELDKDKYTEETFKNLEDLLDEANEILNDTNKNQNEVDTIVKKIKEAREKLQEKQIKEEVKKETKIEENKNDNQLDVPKTLDDIVKIFAILGGCVVVLVVIVILLKKVKK